jgi:putative hemolysin
MDDPGPALDIILKLVLLFVLIFFNAFFAMSEIAIISLNDTKMQKLAEEGNKKAKQIVKLTENPNRFLSTIQIGVTLAGFLASASASQNFADLLVNALKHTAIVNVIPESVINGISVVLITIITSYFSLVLGELAPKRIAMQVPEKVSFKVVGILLFIAKITKPFVKVLSVSTNGVVRLLGFDPNADEENVTEEEIRMMVDVGGEKGVIEDSQKEMIDNIFEFDDLDAGDIMTHRTDMTAIEVSRSLEEVAELAIENGYSRIPVYEDDPDSIVGVLYAKDLLKYVGHNIPADLTISKVMRKALYVPETQSCGDLFKAMNDSHTQFAVVVDEYGGTAGIVTLEDVLESIVGNIQDEYDDEDEEIVQINETTFTIDGITDLDEVDELVGTKLPEGDYDTLGGFVISLLGYLPSESDPEPAVAEYDNLRFTVLNFEDRRIGEIKVEILPKEENEDEDSDSKPKDKDKDKGKDKDKD